MWFVTGKQNKVQTAHIQTWRFKKASFQSGKQFSFKLNEVGEKHKQKEWNNYEIEYFYWCWHIIIEKEEWFGGKIKQ